MTIHTTTMPRLFRYAAIVVGVSLILLCLGLIFFLLMLELFGHQQHPYMSILTLGLLPLGALVGLGITAFGIAGLRASPADHRLPVVDLSDRRVLFTLVTVSLCVLVFVCGSAFGSYQAYEYTDSAQFCGLTCHVMKPENVAHQGSPHSQVACVECHVGSGASWYVQSKVNGMHQLYEVVTDRCPRPIPVPVKNLRPAQDTCQNCHWNHMFYGNRRKEYAYFQSDDKNTRQDMVMLLKIGGDNPAMGPPQGIHWHMNLSNEVTYATLDPKRQDIPWVQVKSRQTGQVRIYRSVHSKFTDADLPKAEKRVMDCTECHNRPAHRFYHPAGAVDIALAQGRIDPTLPFIKQIGVDALEAPYDTQDNGCAGIAVAVRKEYSSKHPQVMRDRAANIDQAIAILQEIYARNYFPEMKADWRAFPDHLDHTHTTGCFRCHDDNHKSEDGKVLTRDCNLCHSIVLQRVNGKVETSTNSDKGLEFAHPTEGDGWKDNDCTDCHGAETPNK